LAVSSGGVGGTASNAGNAKVGDGADGRGFSGGGGFGAIASNSSVTGGRGGFIYYAPVVTLPNSTFAGVNDGSSAAGYFLCIPTSSTTALKLSEKKAYIYTNDNVLFINSDLKAYDSSILSSQGQVLKISKSLNTNSRIETNPLNAGIYFVNINFGNTVEKHKFIKY
jgi:hypothetical protein